MSNSLENSDKIKIAEITYIRRKRKNLQGNQPRDGKETYYILFDERLSEEERKPSSTAHGVRQGPANRHIVCPSPAPARPGRHNFSITTTAPPPSTPYRHLNAVFQSCSSLILFIIDLFPRSIIVKAESPKEIQWNKNHSRACLPPPSSPSLISHSSSSSSFSAGEIMRAYSRRGYPEKCPGLPRWLSR